MSEVRVRGVLSPKAGRLDEFKAVVDEIVAAVREKDKGTLDLAFYLDEAGSTCVAFERYESSQAALDHLANVGDLLMKLPDLCDTAPLEVYGDPSPELRETYAGWNAVVYPELASI